MARACYHGGSSNEGILKLPRALRRDLILMVAIKLGLLALLYVLFFSPTHRPAIDAAAHIIGALPQR